MKKILLALFAVSLVAACTPAPDEFVLVERGRPAAQIVTGAEAPETVGFAARELQTYVANISGATLPIVETAAEGTPSIRLGPAARDVLSADLLADIQRDGYLITVANDTLCIVGIDDTGPHTDIEALLEKRVTHSIPRWDFNRGTLYGTYRLLEELGVRWFLPGEFGERVPQSDTVRFVGTIQENPHFISRLLSYWSMRVGWNFRKDLEKITIVPGERDAIGFSPEENRMWELRMRGATFQIPLNHYPPRTRWRDRFAETNPEYFALFSDGTRATNVQHLCYTCPGVAKESAADIRAYGAGKDCEARGISRIHPSTKRSTNDDNRGWPEETAYGRYFSLLPNDGFRPCGCPRCKALVSDSGIRRERHSRQVWPYIAECARQVPEMNVVCLAYGSYAQPYPGMPKLPPNVVVGYCGYSHPASLYYKDTFDEYEAALQEWADLTQGNLAYWQHYLASNRGESSAGMPEHTPAIYARVVRTMAKHGNHVFCEMMTDSIMFELFNRYLLLKLFYDPNQDEKAIFDDFVTRFYGPQAGPLIGEIYADINAKCIERFKNKYAAYSVWEKLFTEATMAAYKDKADRALARAEGTTYEPAAAAFRDYYLGLMQRGRDRYSDPLTHLLKDIDLTLGDLPTNRTTIVEVKRKDAGEKPSPTVDPATTPAPYAAFDEELRAAKALARESKHEEAIAAYIALGEKCAQPEQKYAAFEAAAVCARLNAHSEERALEIADRIGIQPYAKACRAKVYTWASSAEKVVEEFGNEDFATWPEALAAVGHMNRGDAWRRLENGPEAARDYLKAFQCSKSSPKWSAFRKLGDTHLKLLDDKVTAEAIFRKCAAEGGGSYAGLRARIDLSTLLLAHDQYDEAIKALGRYDHGGYWKGALTLMEATVYRAKGDKAEAIRILNEVASMVGINAHQKKECEQMLAELTGETSE